MTSEPQQAFVWVWLPGAADPVVADRLDTVGGIVTSTVRASSSAIAPGLSRWNASASER